MKTRTLTAAVILTFALFLVCFALVGAEEEMALFCTGEDRFVIHYAGKKSITLEQGVGKQVCVSVVELYTLTGMDDLVELFVWLSGQNSNKLKFEFYKSHAGNVISVTGQQKGGQGGK